ncbi:unnamed protein product [Cuscuta epithymum]|nr:unnamed protein product [Cuscuta epithymum]
MYTRFIVNIVQGETEISREFVELSKYHKLLLLREQSTQKFSYFDVEVTAYKRKVTLRFLAGSLYLIAFKPEYDDTWYEMKGWREPEWLLVELKGVKEVLPSVFVTYCCLEKSGDRLNLTLGMSQIAEATKRLGGYVDGRVRASYDVKPSILQFAQCISESIRFSSIFRRITQNFEVGACLDERMVEDQNRWGNYCKEILNRAVNLHPGKDEKGISRGALEVRVLLRPAFIKFKELSTDRETNQTTFRCEGEELGWS